MLTFLLYTLCKTIYYRNVVKRVSPLLLTSNGLIIIYKNLYNILLIGEVKALLLFQKFECFINSSTKV